jgi:hypothetical protein
MRCPPLPPPLMCIFVFIMDLSETEDCFMNESLNKRLRMSLNEAFKETFKFLIKLFCCQKVELDGDANL